MNSRKNRCILGSLALAAGLLVSAGTALADSCGKSCDEETKLPTFSLGKEWYEVLKQATGFVVRTNGAEVSIQPTLETYRQGKGLDLPRKAMKVTEVTNLGKVPYYPPGFPYFPPMAGYVKGPFDWPTGRAGKDFAWWALFATATDTSGISLATDFKVVPSANGNDRQPVIVVDQPSRRGSLSRPPLINIVEELKNQGKPLTPGQVAWVKKHWAGKTVPGVQTVNARIRYEPAQNKFFVKSINYIFLPDLTKIIPSIPDPCAADPQAAECQPQNPPPPPPGGTPPGDAGAGLDLAVERVSVTEKILPGGDSFASFWAWRVKGTEFTETRAEVWVGGTRACGNLDASIPPGPNASRPQTCRFKAPANPGTYTVRIVLNPARNPAETRYDNNEASATLTVVNPQTPDPGGTKICLGDTTNYVPCSPDHR